MIFLEIGALEILVGSHKPMHIMSGKVTQGLILVSTLTPIGFKNVQKPAGGSQHSADLEP